MSARIFTTVAFALCIAPWQASAQSSYIAPSISVGVAYDDNVFAGAAEEVDDVILRITPVLEAGFTGPRGEARFLHSFDAEKYRDNTDLDSAATRRYTEVDFDYRVTPRLDAELLATTAQTDFAGELLPEFGLELGRTDSRRTTVAPALEYRVTPRMSFLGGLDFARDELTGDRRADTRAGRVGTAHRTSPRSTWTFELERREYEFRPGGDAHSNVLLIGWVNELTPRTTVTLRGGPRNTEVGNEVEAFAAVDYRIPGGTFSLAYERSERVILGQAGLAETDSVWAMWTHPVSAALALRVVPSWVQMRRGDDSADTQRLFVEATYRYSPRVSFTSSYQWMRQSGSLEIVGPVEFTRNVVYFGATFAFAPRVGEVPLAEARRRR